MLSYKSVSAQLMDFNVTTVPPYSSLLTNRLLMTVIGEIILLAAILLGNTFVVFVVAYTPSLRNHQNYLIMSLTASDILSGISIIFVILSILNDHFSLVICKWRFTFLVIWWLASLHSLLAITLDRLVAIMKPLYYPNIATKKCTFSIILIIWIHSVVMGFCLFTKFDSNQIKYCDLVFNVPHYYLKYFVLNFLFVVIIITICYCKIFLIARAQTRKNIRFRKPLLWLHVLKHLKYVRTLLLVIGVLFVSWIPVVIILLLELAQNGDGPNLQTARLIACFFSQVGSVFNPIVYSYRNEEFCISAKKVFCRKIESVPQQNLPTITTTL